MNGTWIAISLLIIAGLYVLLFVTAHKLHATAPGEAVPTDVAQDPHRDQSPAAAREQAVEKS